MNRVYTSLEISLAVICGGLLIVTIFLLVKNHNWFKELEALRTEHSNCGPIEHFTQEPQQEEDDEMIVHGTPISGRGHEVYEDTESE